ncbi:hypothetical protein ES332_A13G242700v1 [Gossypium tomentosum]|uniref:Leucine-rich repeat-containing N-terminal plant-type domain-containing protein n=1 Tax=Gossypium tomentosum TaxID=34277 RepID=A0A5D2MP61_GOSTO|nr:hypothetical protein ES332_A13G242700v1 [Gossypium tomentosum]
MVCWSSKKQSLVAQSTAKAEYVADASAVNQAIWLIQVLADLNLFQEEATEIFCDNKSTVAIAKNLVFHGKAKHFDIKLHVIKEMEQACEIKLVHCNSVDQITDILTKGLGISRFNKLRKLLGFFFLLLFEKLSGSSEACWENEKAALFRLKPFFAHIDEVSISWVEGNCCRWNGVECSTCTRRVTRLFLDNPVGSSYDQRYKDWYLNVSLFLPFVELKSLHLRGKYIAGFIHHQDLNVLSNLKKLNMSYDGMNDFIPSEEELNLKGNVFNSSILSSLGSLSNLKSLSLSHIYAMEGLTVTYTVMGWQNLTSLEELTLTDSSFTSNIVQDIGTLTALKNLVIDTCVVDDNLDLHGFCELRQLQTLAIMYSDWNASFPHCFSELTLLNFLHLFSNKFFGDIYMFKNLASLEYLSLSFNKFSRDIFGLKNLTSLKYLDLSSNNFSEDISGLKNLISLEYLNFSSNNFSGDISGLKNLTSLEYLDLSNNNFSGDRSHIKKALYLVNSSISGHFQLPSTSRRGLSELDVSNNSLDGNIPNKIGAKLPSLKLLNMSNNFFGGGIPISIGDHMISLVVLDLSNNKLSGGIPRHLPMRLVLFNVSSNQLFGDIQSSMENMSHLKTLDLSNNALFGGIPRSMGKMSYLEELVMANNHFEGPIPMEFCKLNYSLIFLDLSANNISGSLPSCFSSLRLTRVYLSRNKLKGPITSFFNSSSLVTLDLSDNHLTGNIPNWIGTLSRLVYLLLNNNHFEGGIPVQLCKLNWLRLIDVSSNNLSGTIPPCLMITISNDSSHAYYANHFNYGDIGFFSADVPIKFTMKSISYFYKGRVLTYLSGIDLSCNKLTGEIPHQFQHFRDIIVLNFSQNSLIGPIPPALSDLSQIESLDLSHNNLSGNIPSQLLGLHFFNCSTDGSSSSMPKNATEEGSIDMKVFYASFVGSYIVMPLCIAIMLYTNPYWRRAWFYHVEAATMSCYYFVLDNILRKRFYEGTI